MMDGLAPSDPGGPSLAFRLTDGPALVRLAAGTREMIVIGADELYDDAAMTGAWHHFADLMRGVSEAADLLRAGERAVLAAALDDAIAALHSAGALVEAARGEEDIGYVAVIPGDLEGGPGALFGSDA